jgi:hypothetical protein
VTTRQLAARIFAGLIAVVVLAVGAIGLALRRSSTAGEKATTSRTVNVQQARKIRANTKRINATLRCLSIARAPQRCIERIKPFGRRGRQGRGATGARGLMGALGRRGATGAQGAAGRAGTTGEQGGIGETGLVGAPGPPGVGEKGNMGPPGRDGVDGIDGAPGPQGPRGPAPVAIETACPTPSGGFVAGFATDADGDLMYTCPPVPAG